MDFNSQLCCSWLAGLPATLGDIWASIMLLLALTYLIRVDSAVAVGGSKGM
jgi:hypothetical protein